MKEVLQKVFVVIFGIFFLCSGCVTTSKYIIADSRIEFPNQKFSVQKPPDDWILTHKTNELARWKQKVTRSSIAVDAGKISPHNFSRSHWAKWVIEWTRDRMEKSSKKCDATNFNEEAISFDSKEFYQVSGLIKCTNFDGEDEGYRINKKLYEKKFIYAVFITQETLYFFTLGSTPQYYNQGEKVLHDIFKSFSFL